MFLKFLLFADLFYVVNQVHFPWETGVPGVAPINILVGLTVLAMRGKPDPLVTKERPYLLTSLLVFFGALTLAWAWAQVAEIQNFMEEATYLKNAIFFPLFYFIYLRCKQDAKTTRQLIIWVLIIAALAGFEAMREGIDYGFGKYNPMRRASGPFGVDWHHANRAGVFYGMFMPMFVALVLFLKGRPWWRLAAIGGCVLIASGALFTYSRQSYFLVILSIAVLLVRRSVIVAVIISVALVASAGYLPDSVFQRVEETKGNKAQGGNEEVDASTASRWIIWAGGMRMLADNPFGVGLNRFHKNIGNYASDFKGFDAHNFYVLTLAECGPHGLIALGFLLFTLFRLAGLLRRRTPRGDPELIALTLGFTVCTLCMCLGGIYGSPTLEGSVMSPYWALAGLLERYVALKNQDDGGAVARADEGPKLSERFPLAAHIRPGG